MDKTILNILKEQLVPAFGCTEPIAVAYAVAKAKEELGESITDLHILVDKNVYKNAVAVFIPGTRERGIPIAAALAIACGKSSYRLQVLKDCGDEDLDMALEILHRGFIDVGIKTDVSDLYIEVLAKSQGSEVKVVIESKHDNIVSVEKDGRSLFSKKAADGGGGIPLSVIQKYSILDLVHFSESADIRELEFISEGIEMNHRIADAWFDDHSNLALGYLNRSSDDLDKYVRAVTAAACSARMGGYPHPVMSCAGSGNHGITAIVPVAAVGEKRHISREKVVRAVALSALITVYIKSYTKTLSPVCGCAVAAGIGASAGIAFLLGGGQNAIDGAIVNMIGGISGMLCDGGKPGCSFKLSIAASSALEAALMALNGELISPLDGIVDKTVEKSIQNLGIVSTRGMSNADDVILEVMLNKSTC